MIQKNTRVKKLTRRTHGLYLKICFPDVEFEGYTEEDWD
jgi:hypothetical protein